MTDSSLVGFFRTGGIPGIFSAACLVTDPCGIPVEFRYVVPVRPNELQRIIYGKQLEEYIKNTVFKQSLEREMSTRPGVVICSPDEWALSGFFGESDCIALRSLENSARSGGIAPDPLTRTAKIGPTESVLASTLRRTLQVRFYNEDPARQQELLEVLKRLDSTMDLLEPLDRLEKAVRHLCQEAVHGEH